MFIPVKVSYTLSDWLKKWSNIPFDQSAVGSYKVHIATLTVINLLKVDRHADTPVNNKSKTRTH